MLPNEIEIIDHDGGFTLCLVLKVASSTLRQWHTDHMDIDPQHKNRYIIETDNLDFSKDVYALWRPSYGRMFSGLHTGLNSLAGQKEPVDFDKNQAEYINQFNIWIKNGMFNHSARYYNTITEHTHLMQHLFRDKFDQVRFIHINQIGHLHTFLNAKYNTAFKCVEENLNPKESFGLHTNMQPFSLLEHLIFKNPAVYQSVTANAAQDYVPRFFFDILKFR